LDRDDEILEELKQSRRAQEELLAEYRRVANAALETQRQSFEIQQRAVAQQTRAVELNAHLARLWKIAGLVAAILIVYLLFRLLPLLGRFP
jgi:hypothetical protein